MRVRDEESKQWHFFDNGPSLDSVFYLMHLTLTFQSALVEVKKRESVFVKNVSQEQSSDQAQRE